MQNFELKFIRQINFTTYDGKSKLTDYETAIEALEGIETFMSECDAFNVPYNVSIRDNNKKKIYSYEEFKKIYK